MEPHAIPFHSTWDVTHPSVQPIVPVISYLVLGIGSAAMVLQCLCSSGLTFLNNGSKVQSVVRLAILMCQREAMECFF
jgi:hypothetical protein